MANSNPTPSTTTEDRLLTRSEVADRLTCSTRFVGKEVERGHLRVTRVGRLVRFRVSDVENYLDGCASGGDAR